MRDDKQVARVQGSTINKPIIHIFSSAGKELATVKVHWKNSVNIMNTHVIGVIIKIVIIINFYTVYYTPTCFWK